MKILLIRHGESIANAKGIHQGQRIDSPLSEKGLAQAKLVAESLEKEKIDVIYSSDSLRAKETAEIIKGKRKIELRLDKRLREFDIGDLTENENRWVLFNDLKKKESKEKGIKTYDIKAPNGESEYDHFLRVKEIIDEILIEKDKSILIVAHGGTNRVFFGAIKQLQKEEMPWIKQNNCCINEIEFDGK
jgi:probable phosphoglycerate mutase